MRRGLLLVLLLVAAAGPAPAAEPVAPTRVAAATLDNGLRVLLLEDHRSPIVSLQLWYRVAPRNETRGATVIAHFLEHLMFRGTPSHAPGEVAKVVERDRGQDNAFTSQGGHSIHV